MILPGAAVLSGTNDSYFAVGLRLLKQPRSRLQIVARGKRPARRAIRGSSTKESRALSGRDGVRTGSGSDRIRAQLEWLIPSLPLWVMAPSPASRAGNL